MARIGWVGVRLWSWMPHERHFRLVLALPAARPAVPGPVFGARLEEIVPDRQAAALNETLQAAMMREMPVPLEMTADWPRVTITCPGVALPLLDEVGMVSFIAEVSALGLAVGSPAVMVWPNSAPPEVLSDAAELYVI